LVGSLCGLSVCFLILLTICSFFFFFSSRRRHTRSKRDWSSDVCSSDLVNRVEVVAHVAAALLVQALDQDAKRLRFAIQLLGEVRSEERRVGKECRSRWWREH